MLVKNENVCLLWQGLLDSLQWNTIIKLNTIIRMLFTVTVHLTFVFAKKKRFINCLLTCLRIVQSQHQDLWHMPPEKGDDYNDYRLEMLMSPWACFFTYLSQSCLSVSLHVLFTFKETFCMFFMLSAPQVGQRFYYICPCPTENAGETPLTFKSVSLKSFQMVK